MQLTTEQLETYNNQGYLFFPNCFSKSEVEAMKAELPSLLAVDTPGRVLEQDNTTVRAIHGVHKTTEVFRRLSQTPRIVEPAMKILGSQVYVYQFKINLKAAFSGDMWPWHQDYIYWLKEDGMPSEQAVNVVIFLDEVNEFNGPIYLIPSSHKEGMISVLNQEEQSIAYQDKSEWISDFTANLKYITPQRTVTRLINQYGIIASKGAVGSVLYFHPNCVHGSANNISPYSRNLALFTYNSVNNIPHKVENPRPEFLVSRDYRPIDLCNNIDRSLV